MKVVRTIAELETALAEMPPGPLGLVPTMGALHEGHLSLLRAARAESAAVVMSLFVNPAQFSDEHDLAAYPSDFEHDRRLAEQEGVDVLFAPAPQALYPPGFQTWVEVTELGATAEGTFRPGHFRGVATICLKLFNLVRPQRAYFGQKDAQQVAVLRRMVRDLNVDVDIRVLPTVRDPDGLALSSRNTRLTEGERAQALALPRALAIGDRDAALAELEGLDIDYVEVLDLDPPVLAGAIRVGSVRLIDNVPLTKEPR